MPGRRKVLPRDGMATLADRLATPTIGGLGGLLEPWAQPLFCSPRPNGTGTLRRSQSTPHCCMKTFPPSAVLKASFLLTVVPAVVLGALIPTATAEEPASGVHLRAAPDAEHAIPHHHVALFVGAASRYEVAEEEERETGLALGIEYEYRMAEHWGAGLLAEAVTTTHARDGILVVPLNWHPWEWLKLSAAPGVEFVEHGAHEFVVRLAAAYEFELGHYNLAPEVSVDFTRESQTVVYGLSFGRRF